MFRTSFRQQIRPMRQHRRRKRSTSHSNRQQISTCHSRYNNVQFGADLWFPIEFLPLKSSSDIWCSVYFRKNLNWLKESSCAWYRPYLLTWTRCLILDFSFWILSPRNSHQQVCLPFGQTDWAKFSFGCSLANKLTKLSPVTSERPWGCSDRCCCCRGYHLLWSSDSSAMRSSDYNVLPVHFALLSFHDLRGLPRSLWFSAGYHVGRHGRTTIVASLDNWWLIKLKVCKFSNIIICLTDVERCKKTSDIVVNVFLVLQFNMCAAHSIIVVTN